MRDRMRDSHTTSCELPGQERIQGELVHYANRDTVYLTVDHRKFVDMQEVAMAALGIYQRLTGCD